MKRFRFNLEKVLELRQFNEQEAKNELGRAISILNGIEAKIKKNTDLHSQARHERFEGINASGSAGAPSGPASMMSWDAYILRLEQEAQRLAEEAAQAELFIEEKRVLYLEASRELKVMEKLREKREAEYRKESLAADTRTLDDLWREKE